MSMRVTRSRPGADDFVDAIDSRVSDFGAL